MYVILVYDICKEGNGQKRWNRVFKLCKQSTDSVIIFKSRNERWLDKNVIGLQQDDPFMI